MAAKYRTTPLPSSEMPPGIPYIVGNEAAERFSYYGVSPILGAVPHRAPAKCCRQRAPLDENTANEWQHNFMAAVYVFPIRWRDSQRLVVGQIPHDPLRVAACIAWVMPCWR